MQDIRELKESYEKVEQLQSNMGAHERRYEQAQPLIQNIQKEL